jgi:hypothetical protein
MPDRAQVAQARQGRVGAVLEVRILAPDRIAKVARFTIRKGKTPLARYLCLPPGAKRATACT